MKKFKLTFSQLIQSALAVAGVLLIASFQNCGEVNFSSTGPDAVRANGNALVPAVPPTCTDALRATTQKLKIHFMVDNSGSTNTTDPNKYYRHTIIQNFLDTYSSKSNFNYSFGYFSDQANILTPTLPWGDFRSLQKSLNDYLNVTAGGSTNYVAAFNAIEETISKDPQSAGWKYIVVFFSDGEPKDITADKDGTYRTGITKLVAHLQDTVSIMGSDVTVSSVYFGAPSNPNAQNLATMAAVGNGQFIDSNKANSITISDIINIPGKVCTPN